MNKIWILGLIAVAIISCSKEPLLVEEDRLMKPLVGPYAPKEVNLEVPFWMPPQPKDDANPLTEQGIALGRQLFYDPILSADSTQSCSSCHKQAHAFSDPRQYSIGVLGMEGKRNAMALINLAYNRNGLFWDGRSENLKEQALIPVEDHLEMNESWDHVVLKLADHPSYPELFRAAFGISTPGEINKELVVRALAQFEQTLISSNSRFDQVVWQNKGWLTDAELRGKQLFFFEESQLINHPGCSHCHFDPLFGDNSYRNNGLDAVDDLADFADLGRGAITGNLYDNGKFRVPTLRNIALTAPYMHDGRMATLEEVLNHYGAGGHGVSNEDVNIAPFELNEQQKADLIAFLHTLTDTSFVNNPAFSNPFE